MDQNKITGASIISSSDGSVTGTGDFTAVSHYPGIWLGNNTTSPSTSNYSLLYDFTNFGTAINAPSSNSVFLRINNSTIETVNSSGISIAGSDAANSFIVQATPGSSGIAPSGASVSLNGGIVTGWGPTPTPYIYVPVATPTASYYDDYSVSTVATPSVWVSMGSNSNGLTILGTGNYEVTGWAQITCNASAAVTIYDYNLSTGNGSGSNATPVPFSPASLWYH